MNLQGQVVITGGAGFLGSHLCRRYLAEGAAVACVDNLLTGRRSNIETLQAHPRFTFVEHDAGTPLDVSGPVALIMHFASPASPRDYVRWPIETLRAGALGTLHALELALAKSATFVLASSSEIYGDPAVNPQPEEYWGHVNPIGPRSVYDEAKRYAEALTMAYHRARGVPVRIARIFNTYGPGMRIDDGRVLPAFMCQALRGEPLTVYGNGTQTRSFCYVDDLVEGIVRLAAGPEPGPVNFGNPDEVRVLDLAGEIITLAGSRSEIVFRPLPPDDPKVRRPDISKARSRLGWNPRVTRQEGLRRTLPYFREQLLQQAPR